MDVFAVLIIQSVYAIASLALISVGLALIFGMLRIINFAHGEFLMLGGFAFVIAVSSGVNMWVAMFFVAPVIVGAVGYAVERLVIRHLYGRRVVETVLATWGISLVMIGISSSAVGYFQRGVTPPFGNVRIGAYSEGGYTFFVIAVAIFVFAGLYGFMRFTSAGLIARGTMQQPDMASALGVSKTRVNALTFVAGSALAGFAGAVMAPITGVVPTSGAAYIAKSFITVIIGGAAPITGTMSAATLLGMTSYFTTLFTRPVIGEVVLLTTAIVLLRFLPTGITGGFFRRGM